MRRVPQRELDLLAQVPLFADCTKPELRELAILGTTVDVAPGHALIREGASGREFFIVIEGEAECSVRGVSTAVLGPGDYFGELALIDGGPRTATVRATTPLRVIVMNNLEFNRVLLTSPRIAVKLLRNIVGRLRDVHAMAIY
jgi:CRP-like cAMP-binding protein